MMEKTEANMIERKSLHLELVERIRPLIIDSQLVPGRKVPEKDLCERFQVSRTPMREALKVLASEGLVRLEPNRGAWVTTVTTNEVKEVFPILGVLEALSGELACKYITDAEIREVRALHEDMLQSYRARDLAAYFESNQKIHRAILLAARNDTLTKSCQTLSARMQRARYIANMSEERWANAVSEHEQIIKTLEARDGQSLSAVLVEHMKNKQDSVLRWLSTTQTDQEL
ncbi:GntR family transcriptional regulator [Candidatus Halocynthiibacter alkanivorans]|jgi:DNA-binding GntR family transcriptional regulator|uniref:GntR family transcriptional regulator n=1 Tax=Candidatus Halocynthiibacter alkanivorans TaxID=2267619 RepID=UPI000DF328DF|nr:GntR family transcriptional regulator [Candidatus Halocynthiibacter alkanivorans]